LILLFLYGIPLFAGVGICRFSSVTPSTLFMIINFGAIVIGCNVVQIESMAPFPTVPLEPPDYKYEVRQARLHNDNDRGFTYLFVRYYPSEHTANNVFCFVTLP
jgi:hypothetical protein